MWTFKAQIHNPRPIETKVWSLPGILSRTLTSVDDPLSERLENLVGHYSTAGGMKSEDAKSQGQVIMYCTVSQMGTIIFP